MPKNEAKAFAGRRFACSRLISLLIAGQAAVGGGEKMPRLEQLLTRAACWAAANAAASPWPPDEPELRAAATYCDCRLWQMGPWASADVPAMADTNPARIATKGPERFTRNSTQRPPTGPFSGPSAWRDPIIT